MSSRWHVAVDLGAGSGRVVLGACGEERLEAVEVHRFAGLWLLDECRRLWAADGTETFAVDHCELQVRLRDRGPSKCMIDPDDPRFIHPADMPAAIREFLAEHGQRAPEDPVDLAHCVLTSLALRYAAIVEELRELGAPVRGIHVVGGGSRNAFLNRATANATGLPVRTGPVEATAIGNLTVQATQCGRFAHWSEGRKWLRRALADQIEEYEPDDVEEWKGLSRGRG